eukprot:361839-Chlamydomonas_euryale.AAC.3
MLLQRSIHPSARYSWGWLDLPTSRGAAAAEGAGGSAAAVSGGPLRQQAHLPKQTYARGAGGARASRPPPKPRGADCQATSPESSSAHVYVRSNWPKVWIHGAVGGGSWQDLELKPVRLLHACILTAARHTCACTCADVDSCTCIGAQCTPACTYNAHPCGAVPEDMSRMAPHRAPACSPAVLAEVPACAQGIGQRSMRCAWRGRDAALRLLLRVVMKLCHAVCKVERA